MRKRKGRKCACAAWWPLTAKCKKCGHWSMDPWTYICLRALCQWDGTRMVEKGAAHGNA